MQDIIDNLKLNAKVVKFEKTKYTSSYYLELNPGAKLNKIKNSAYEIGLAMRADTQPSITTLMSEGLVLVEFSNNVIEEVAFSELTADLVASKAKLPFIVGRDKAGNNIIEDMAMMPNLLISGATGSGKSVALHSIINSLILSNKDVRLVMVDPKIVELVPYRNIKELIAPIANTPAEAHILFDRLIKEMNRRFNLLASESANNIHEYNLKNKNLPYIVLFIDEFGDLVMSDKNIQAKVCLLAQKSRACGIHIVISTQRPSANVVNGLVKANFPARISFKVSSSIDSRIVLGRNGAEQLNGKGDGLIFSSDHDMTRFQGAYISQDYIKQFNSRNSKSLFKKISDLWWLEM